MAHDDSCLQMLLKLVECKSRKKKIEGTEGRRKVKKDKERELEGKII